MVFLGPPGSGKGTQSSIMSSKLSMLKISAGDVIRDIMQEKSEFADSIRSIVNEGNLLSDDVVSSILLKKLSAINLSDGVILDGYPRTIGQAKDLDKFLLDNNQKLDKVIDLLVDEEVIIKRISGRYSCSDCGEIYNLYYNPTKYEGVCDRCGSSKFTTRKDDSAEAVKVRLRAYNEQNGPLVEFYKKKGLLVSIFSNLPINELAEKILQN